VRAAAPTMESARRAGASVENPRRLCPKWPSSVVRSRKNGQARPIVRPPPTEPPPPPAQHRNAINRINGAQCGLSGDQSEVTSSANGVSAMVSPRLSKTGHGNVAESASDSGNESHDETAAVDDFAAALAMIAALPLTAEEKAEAVRRLMSSEQ